MASSGTFVIAGVEQRRPYERPPLSNGLLLGAEECPFVQEAGWPPEPAWGANLLGALDPQEGTAGCRP
ncbi:hypothetical protein [Symbioplanes lichenis]|uniref:hypothetical protein n=1 Tax=Symbioplanes lichenis TaxID=1629072 RepID=UPI0027384834|nr:hypothetical protein [Actinoplanes lichenis]